VNTRKDRKIDHYSAEFVYRPPIEKDMTPTLKEKYQKAIEITKNTLVINLKMVEDEHTQRS
jgi:hypothetical protein